MSTPRPDREPTPVGAIPGEAEPAPVKAWQLIDTGRYQPRRIRGSFPGRELG
jgi:hypothetical protein